MTGIVAVDDFAEYAASPSGSAIGVLDVTPSDTDEIPFVTRAISFGSSGTLIVTFLDGSETTYAEGELVPGVLHPMRIRAIGASSTATNIKAYR